MTRKGYPLPPGAVKPRAGYPKGWGPPFATPRDCPAHYWNHLCPWGRLGRCQATCYGLTPAYAAGARQPGESTHAWLLRQAGGAGSGQAAAQPVDAAFAQRVQAIRRKRGVRAAHRFLVGRGYTAGAADVYLATGIHGAYSGATDDAEEMLEPGSIEQRAMARKLVAFPPDHLRAAQALADEDHPSGVPGRQGNVSEVIRDALAHYLRYRGRM